MFSKGRGEIFPFINDELKNYYSSLLLLLLLMLLLLF